MKRHLTLTLALVAASFFLIAAGRGNGPANLGPAQTVNGTVVAWTADPGAGPSTMTLRVAGRNDLTVYMGPIWFLEEAGFTAAPGQQVRLTLRACTACPGGYAAVRAENLTSRRTLQLRDAAGFPLWRGPGRGGRGPGGAPCVTGETRGNRPTPAGSGLDLTKVETVTGDVVSWSGGPGIGEPTLVLTAGGEELTISVGPYWAWLASGIEAETGKELTVTYAPCTARDRLAALSVTDEETGETAQLRDPATGFPIAPRGTRGGRR